MFPIKSVGCKALHLPACTLPACRHNVSIGDQLKCELVFCDHIPSLYGSCCLHTACVSAQRCQVPDSILRAAHCQPRGNGTYQCRIRCTHGLHVIWWCWGWQLWPVRSSSHQAGRGTVRPSGCADDRELKARSPYFGTHIIYIFGKDVFSLPAVASDAAVASCTALLKAPTESHSTPHQVLQLDRLFIMHRNTST